MRVEVSVEDISRMVGLPSVPAEEVARLVSEITYGCRAYAKDDKIVIECDAVSGVKPQYLPLVEHVGCMIGVDPYYISHNQLMAVAAIATAITGALIWACSNPDWANSPILQPVCSVLRGFISSAIAYAQAALTVAIIAVVIAMGGFVYRAYAG